MSKTLICAALAVVVAVLVACGGATQPAEQATPVDGDLPVLTKISLNAFSFNTPLLKGEMTLDDVLMYAAQRGFEAVDLTGYYFPGYPEVPSDGYIWHIRRMAFELGLEICGTGVRNDFVQADPAARAADVQMVKNWVDVCAKLGGQTVRIFAGKNIPEGYTWDEIARWAAVDIRDCADYAAARGVMLAIQNHNDFLKTADEVEKLFAMIDHPSVGLMLDIGSYATSGDPYREIEQTVKYAITWQVKEKVTVAGEQVLADLDRLKEIIDASGYRGYLPIEAIGPGEDSYVKTDRMFYEVYKRFGR